jgi:hypothetical protein
LEVKVRVVADFDLFMKTKISYLRPILVEVAILEVELALELEEILHVKFQ